MGAAAASGVAGGEGAGAGAGTATAAGATAAANGVATGDGLDDGGCCFFFSASWNTSSQRSIHCKFYVVVDL